MGLMLHAGAKALDRDALAVLPLPAARGARHVVRPFIDDVELVDRFLGDQGFMIASEAFGTKTDAKGFPSQFFGAMEIKPKALVGQYIAAGESDFALTVGIRGSYDQSLPRGLAVGSRVFVCDNLAFSGEVDVYAKQTTNIASRIENLLAEAVSKVPTLADIQNQRFDAYRNYSLTKAKGDAILVECVRMGILNPSDIGKAIKEWDEPSHAEHVEQGFTVWRLYNALTESIKPANQERAHVLSAWNRTVPLTKYLDEGIGLNTIH